MPEEGGRSPPRDGSCGEKKRSEEPLQAVYLVPVYAVAIVDPNELGESGLPLNFRGEATGAEVAVDQKRQKLETRRRCTLPEYDDDDDDDDDDPHKPTPKRLRNRMKSQKSRDKKKAYMNALEGKVKELEKMISVLEEKCLALQNENGILKNEALETDPCAEEKLMLYYKKLQKDRENTEKSVDNQEDAPGKTSESEGGILEKCAEIAGQECTLEIDIDDGTPVIKISMQHRDVDVQGGIVGKFSEADDLDCASEVNTQRNASLMFESVNCQEGTLRRCTEIRNNISECGG